MTFMFAPMKAEFWQSIPFPELFDEHCKQIFPWVLNAGFVVYDPTKFFAQLTRATCRSGKKNKNGNLTGPEKPDPLHWAATADNKSLFIMNYRHLMKVIMLVYNMQKGVEELFQDIEKHQHNLSRHQQNQLCGYLEN